MQHGNQQRTLGRTRRGRTALLRGLAIDLIKNGKVTTTFAKAKEVQPLAERLISYGKIATLSSRRQAAKTLGQPSNDLIQKLFENVAPRYEKRSGGYTRITKIGQTAGREQAVIELV